MAAANPTACCCWSPHGDIWSAMMWAWSILPQLPELCWITHRSTPLEGSDCSTTAPSSVFTDHRFFSLNKENPQAVQTHQVACHTHTKARSRQTPRGWGIWRRLRLGVIEPSGWHSSTRWWWPAWAPLSPGSWDRTRLLCSAPQHLPSWTCAAASPPTPPPPSLWQWFGDALSRKTRGSDGCFWWANAATANGEQTETVNINSCWLGG